MTTLLEKVLGWQGACLAWAALHLAIGLPLHRFLAPPAPPPRKEAEPTDGDEVATPRMAMVLLAYVFAATWVFQSTNSKDVSAKAHLNALERIITASAVEGSKFKAILNEKDPPPGTTSVPVPMSFRSSVVSDRVRALRSHPDFRTARRALIISRLAQVIAERQVQGGLRRALLTQATRL